MADVFVGPHVGAEAGAPTRSNALLSWIDAQPRPLRRRAAPTRRPVERGAALFNDTQNVGLRAPATRARASRTTRRIDVGTGRAFQVPSLVGRRNARPVHAQRLRGDAARSVQPGLRRRPARRHREAEQRPDRRPGRLPEQPVAIYARLLRLLRREGPGGLAEARSATATSKRAWASASWEPPGVLRLQQVDLGDRARLVLRAHELDGLLRQLHGARGGLDAPAAWSRAGCGRWRGRRGCCRAAPRPARVGLSACASPGGAARRGCRRRRSPSRAAAPTAQE